MNGGLLLRFSVLVFAEVLFLAALNFFDDWTLQQMPVRFVGTAFASGLAFLAVVSHFPLQIGIRRQAIIFWSVAVVLRLITLPLAPSDELSRHQWEGKVQRAGFNPYLIAPSDPQLDDLRRDFPGASKINHPELRGVDAPGAELMFRFLSSITDRPLFYKILFAIGDLAVVALLLRLIGGDQRYRSAAWYAWNPLAVYSFAGAGHFDSIMILALIGVILALVRACPERQSNGSIPDPDGLRQSLWAVVAAILFGITISLNVVAASLFMLFLFALHWRAIFLPISIIIPILLSFPFGFPQVQVWHSLGQITHLSRLNDLFWWLIEDTVWPNPYQRTFHYLPVIIVCLVAVSLFFVRNWKRGMLWVLGTAVVLSPILYPWYCTWILPLATWRRAYAWHVLSITLFSYYLFWDERLFALPWHAEPWMRALIIAPVLASLIMLAAKNRTAVAAT
jgi:alpha-1,6-mannosyltransferase